MLDVNDVNDDIGDGINQLSEADQPIDYTELILEDSFLGEYPFETIMEGISNQISSYMTIEDRTDYVDIFYDQLAKSFKSTSNPEEDHPRERIDALNKILDDFTDRMARLFEERLAIVIAGVEEEVTDQDEIESAIRLIYDFFVLNAPETFKTVMTNEITHALNEHQYSEEELLPAIEEAVDTGYTPLVTKITPTEFLLYSGNQDMYDLFNDCKMLGNFLKKFTPRLYSNEEYRVLLINDIYINFIMSKNKEEL